MQLVPWAHVGFIVTLLVLVRHSRVFGHIFGADTWVLRMNGVAIVLACLLQGLWPVCVSISTGCPEPDGAQWLLTACVRNMKLNQGI